MLSRPLALAAQDPHIWWGVSVEDRRYGLPRMDVLRETPVAMRFLSIEPLLEDLGEINLEGIAWVIVGGESGHGARPMDEHWVLNIQRQCRTQGVPFFFKQWGGARKSEAGRLLQGRTYDEVPERMYVPPPDARSRKELLRQVQAEKVSANTAAAPIVQLPLANH